MTTSEILAALRPLFVRANQERQWFYLVCEGLMFSPKELRAAHAKGQYILGPEHWVLVEPPKSKRSEGWEQ